MKIWVNFFIILITLALSFSAPAQYDENDIENLWNNEETNRNKRSVSSESENKDSKDDESKPNPRSFYGGGLGFNLDGQHHYFDHFRPSLRGPYATPYYYRDFGFYYQPYYKRLGWSLYGGRKRARKHFAGHNRYRRSISHDDHDDDSPIPALEAAGFKIGGHHGHGRRYGHSYRGYGGYGYGGYGYGGYGYGGHGFAGHSYGGYGYPYRFGYSGYGPFLGYGYPHYSHYYTPFGYGGSSHSYY